mmetsp:Transcript_22840/g.67979  ORF Transcript_22840/g.67979 Transcript_22840/m.67979 type:complete len:300 (+) Transcript_22840:1973-2872(+)
MLLLPVPSSTCQQRTEKSLDAEKTSVRPPGPGAEARATTLPWCPPVRVHISSLVAALYTRIPFRSCPTQTWGTGAGTRQRAQTTPAVLNSAFGFCSGLSRSLTTMLPAMSAIHTSSFTVTAVRIACTALSKATVRTHFVFLLPPARAPKFFTAFARFIAFAAAMKPPGPALAPPPPRRAANPPPALAFAGPGLSAPARAARPFLSGSPPVAPGAESPPAACCLPFGFGFEGDRWAAPASWKRGFFCALSGGSSSGSSPSWSSGSPAARRAARRASTSRRACRRRYMHWILQADSSISSS